MPGKVFGITVLSLKMAMSSQRFQCTFILNLLFDE